MHGCGIWPAVLHWAVSSAAVCLPRTRPPPMLRNGLLREINEQAIARLRRDWHGFALTRGRSAAATPGRRRRSRPVRPCVAVPFRLCRQYAAGSPRAARLALEPASPEEIKRRQQAVAELGAAPRFAANADPRRTLAVGSWTGHRTLRDLGGRRSLACRAAVAAVAVSQCLGGRFADPRV